MVKEKSGSVFIVTKTPNASLAQFKCDSLLVSLKANCKGKFDVETNIYKNGKKQFEYF